jgi:phospholipid/cholesterol/gamma-HCH transport system substrate-binding protein
MSVSVRRQQAQDLAKLSAFLVLAIFVTIWLAAVTGDVQSGDKSDYRARFHDVSGLARGDQVRVAGVSVGKVTGIEVQPDATVVVGFDVDEDLRLDTTTTATVRYRNLIGDRLLELDRGTRPGKALAPGDVIDIGRTAAAVDLDALLNGFKPLFAGLNPAQINELSGQLIDVLQGQTSAVRHLVDSVGSFTTTIGDRSALVGQVVTNLNSVLGTVATRKDTLGQLVTELSGLVHGLSKQDTQVLDAAARIDRFAGSAAQLLASARGDLTPTLQGLATSARLLNKNADTLDQVLAKYPGHYARIQDTASYGSFFNFYLCGVRVQTDAATTPYITSDAARCRR